MSSVLRRATRVGAVAALVLVLAGGVAYATIPAANGTITGCYARSGGTLRVIDPSATNCKQGETQITWSQSGEPGPCWTPRTSRSAGSAGPAGPQGETGPAGPARTGGDRRVRRVRRDKQVHQARRVSGLIGPQGLQGPPGPTPGNHFVSRDFGPSGTLAPGQTETFNVACALLGTAVVSGAYSVTWPGTGDEPQDVGIISGRAQQQRTGLDIPSQENRQGSAGRVSPSSRGQSAWT